MKVIPGTLSALVAFLSCVALEVAAQNATVDVFPKDINHRVSRYLTGACIEDVNHEIYGGIYSQMLFGESFQEPAVFPAIQGFRAYGGQWEVKEGELRAGAAEGSKLITDLAKFEDGEAGVEIFFPAHRSGNAGLILRVQDARPGADAFVGYEVSLETAGRLVLGRHRKNWEPLRNVPCDVPVGRWVPLVVRMTGATIEIEVSGKRVLQFQDKEHPLGSGQVGLRTWQREASFRNFWCKQGSTATHVPFQYTGEPWEGAVSGMWRGVKGGSVQGRWALETQDPFTGRQSQRITFTAGTGEVGVENQGLNRWGLNFLKGKPYEGYLWAKAPNPVDMFVAVESTNGQHVYSEQRLKVRSSEWQRLEFRLTPNANVETGRFTIKLKTPGEVLVGHAFLQPGQWGRFKGLPDRRDLVEALINQGVTVLRYGGSMVNHEEYRWKKMIGPRDRRPPYRGTWYPYSSNGWGILDFLDLCEAAGFLGIPAFNMDENPADMADFIEYVNGPRDSVWGSKRAAQGHPKPYRLKYLELGNEERVDERYWTKFEKLATALWAKDRELVLVVGDFQYEAPIQDPFNFKGAASGITNLAAHQKILALAKAQNREVWFDVHLNTEGPNISSSVKSLPTFISALKSVAAGARHEVVVFELNAGNHQHKRALANALAILASERLNLPIVTSANCLQPDGQNDNGWDQGLLFLNPSKVWLQPPGYVTQMLSKNYQPLLVRCSVESPGDQLEANAVRSDDGKTLVLQLVNQSEQPMASIIRLNGFVPSVPTAEVEELAGQLNERNTSAEPNRIVPVKTKWHHNLNKGPVGYTLQPHSFTVLRFR